jgi:hypothetical protein
MTDSDKAALVENMLLLRKEDFDELLNSAAQRGAQRCLAQLGLENGQRRSRTSATCGNFSRLGETQGAPLGGPRSRW